MPAYIETMDTSKPAGSRDISLGDDDIREYKRAMAERLNEDHVMPADETGINTVGYHRKVTLIKQLTDPDAVADTGIFYTKDTGSGKMEAFFIDEAGNITQLTIRGNLARLAKEVIMWFGTIATIPTGLYLCNGLGGRPDLRDQFLVGARQDDSGIAKTNVEGSLAQTAVPTHNHTGTVGSTTLTLAQIPSHTHTIGYSTVTGPGGGGTSVWGLVSAVQGTENTGSAGGDTSHNHTIPVSTAIPPYYALAFISPYNV